jgi:hypothetical protein
MNMVSQFEKHYRDPEYDRLNNPERRPIVELLPIAASWTFSDQPYRVDLTPCGVIQLLHDASGLAIVNAPFGAAFENQAYILNADGSLRFTVAKSSVFSVADRFSDVYYVADVLCFFVSGPSGDLFIEYNPAEGQSLRQSEYR